jgi:radical SAM superfamily enzyme YgiQ (UPF0313 family)
VALVWPGEYGSGMSSLGFLWVHGYLTSRPDALSERFFWELGPYSLERGRKLDDFDLVAASLVLENDYWALPAILSQGGVPPLRKDRGDRHPLVLAGGVGVWSNPWPVLPYLDLVLAGEGEAAWPVLADLFAQKDFRSLGKEERLSLLAKTVPGALAPGLWPDEAGAGASKVSPAFLPWPFPEGLLPPSSPIIAKGAEFSSAALVEISRGCPWGCRFCLAGYLYRPHRTWPVESILEALSPWLAPGAKAGLVSPAVADHEGLDYLLDELYGREVSVGLSSMRLSKVTERLALKLSKAGLQGLAVAPEGGSEKLRKAINKNLTESEIFSAARLLAKGGLKRLKLYFMIGLPEEDDDDLASLAKLSKEVFSATRIGKGGPKVTVSAANFTPKPHTPFEEAPLCTEGQLRRKGALLRELLRKEAREVELRLDPPKWTLVQGLLARGGLRSQALVEALRLTEGRSGPALKLYGYEESDPVHFSGEIGKPWRVIAPRAGTEILLKEREKSLIPQLSEPCPKTLKCGRCRACEPEGGPGE